MDRPEWDGSPVFAISYDPVDTLRTFADEHGITFALLSDVGSAVIRRLGLINRHIEEQQAYYGKPVGDKHRGLPYPGTFLLDEQGTVVDKQFEQSYRVRPTPAALLEDLRGEVIETTDGPVATDTGPGEVAAVAWSHAATYRPLERLRVHVRIDMPEDVHVYGQRSSAAYTPLDVRITAPEGVEASRAVLPDDREVRLEGLGETAYVHEGRLCTQVDVVAPHSDEPLLLTVAVSYQACTESVCHPPGQLRMELPLNPHAVDG